MCVYIYIIDRAMVFAEVHRYLFMPFPICEASKEVSNTTLTSCYSSPIYIVYTVLVGISTNRGLSPMPHNA